MTSDLPNEEEEDEEEDEDDSEVEGVVVLTVN